MTPQAERPPEPPPPSGGSRQRDADGANRRTASLAALVVALLLIIVAIYVARALHTNSAMEDCLLAHRLNCDVAGSSRP